MRKVMLFVLAAACLALAALPARAAQVTVTVTNITQGIWFTPLLVTAHDPGVRLFHLDQIAPPELQAMAEGGDIAGLLSALGGEDADTVANPAGGLLGPGQSATATLQTSAGNRVLSLVAMLLPTNDGFVGLDSAPLTPAGSHTVFLYGYDAGTEANNELMNTENGGAPGVAGIPADPSGFAGTGGTGVTNTELNTTVHIHRGVVGDLDATGGASDLDSGLHRWLNPVARVVYQVN
jgi:hypothetical protein